MIESHMKYLKGMDILEDNSIMDRVLLERSEYNSDIYTSSDVEEVLEKDFLTPEDFGVLLSKAAGEYLEQMAQKALSLRKKYFGNSVTIFAPLYLANFCENHCVYCGFNCTNSISRVKLNMEEIEREMQELAKTGLQDILILTGESKVHSPVEYIGEACKLATKYFKQIGVEIYPVNIDDYKYLRKCGVDYVTVFQETYNPETYEKVHKGGHKRIYPYRFCAQERAMKGGMRGVGFAALLGLDDFRKDVYATGLHAYLVQRKYPHAEITFSCPRLCPTQGDKSINPKDVYEKQLFQVICAYRIFMPFAALTISTRESAKFRDNVIQMAATKISASVSTGVGAHEENDDRHGDAQFEIADSRSTEEVIIAIKNMGLQPVMADYINI